MTHSAPAGRRLASAVLLACGAGLLAACSSSAGSASPGSTVTVTATPSAQAATPSAGSGGGGTGASSSAPASGGAEGGPPICATSALQVSLGQGNGAAGSSIVPIQFNNQSSSACTMFGFPGVSFVTGTGGSQIGASAAEDKSAARATITLAPGAVAHALLRVADAQNFPAARCKLVTAHWLKIYPPGQTAPLYLKFTSAACSSTSTSVRVLNVQTLQSGNGNP
jgi:Protein of unknown function (DUF4232)